MRSKNEMLEQIQRSYKNTPYDGIITEVADNYVHVRLAGASRRIIHNVIIPDHIIHRHEVLYRGLFCKIARQYDRESSGRWILTDILPTITYGNYAGGAVGIPGTPRISVQSDCDSSEWNISWQAVEGASYYQLYWATDESGIGATLITETVYRSHSIAFDTSTPPKIFFAVRAVAGVNDGELCPWTTDPVVYSGGSVILFGDDQNHGHVTSAGVRWQVLDGKVEKSTDGGGYWANVTPTAPDNDFSQTPAPTATDIQYIQVLGDDQDIYVLGTYDDESIVGGWIFFTDDDGDTWTDEPIGNGSKVQAEPIWAAQNTTRFIVVFWADFGYSSLNIGFLAYDKSDLTTEITGNTLSSDATRANVTDRTYWAAPHVVEDNDDLWFFFGRMKDPFYGDMDDGIYHILSCLYDAGGDTYTSIIQDLGYDWVQALIVGPEASPRNLFYASVNVENPEGYLWDFFADEECWVLDDASGCHTIEWDNSEGHTQSGSIYMRTGGTECSGMAIYINIDPAEDGYDTVTFWYKYVLDNIWEENVDFLFGVEYSEGGGTSETVTLIDNTLDSGWLEVEVAIDNSKHIDKVFVGSFWLTAPAGYNLHLWVDDVQLGNGTDTYPCGE